MPTAAGALKEAGVDQGAPAALHEPALGGAQHDGSNRDRRKPVVFLDEPFDGVDELVVDDRASSGVTLTHALGRMSSFGEILGNR